MSKTAWYYAIAAGVVAVIAIGAHSEIVHCEEAGGVRLRETWWGQFKCYDKASLRVIEHKKEEKK